MKKIKKIETKKVLLPFSTYELSSKEQKYFAKSARDGEPEIYGGTFFVAIYSLNGEYPSYACMSFLGFGIDKDRHCFKPSKDLTGIESVKISNSAGIDYDFQGYEQIKIAAQKSRKEVVDNKLIQKLIGLLGFDKDELINKFVDPEAALKNISFILVDKLFPGNSHAENLIRLQFLAEASEKKRLKMLWENLFKNTEKKSFTTMSKYI